MNCLHTAYTERMVYLQVYGPGPAATGPATYRMEKYRVNANVQLPQVKSVPETRAARLFNALVRSVVDPGLLIEGKYERLASGEYEASIVRNRYAVAYLVLSLPGGAHPSPVRRSFVFDLERGESVPLARLFRPGAEYLSVLARKARENLNAQLRAGTWASDPDSIAIGTEPKPENFELYTITANTLVLRFPPYQVGPYVAGDATVEIPASALESILDPAGPLGKTPSAASR